MSWRDRDYFRELRGGGRFADNPLNWAPSIGSVAGIRIRVHILFLLFIGFELLGARDSIGFVSLWLFILFGSVFLHELGHCFAARRVGGSADEVLMWPLGGLAYVNAPMLPWPQFVTVVCGPLVNLVLFLVSSALLRFNVSFNLMAGWYSEGSAWNNPYIWCSLVSRVNMLLFLFNLWPMLPMDGGRMFQCAVWRPLGLPKATMLTTTVGMVCAVVLGLYGLVHMNFLLIAIAFMGYITCYQERHLTAAGLRQETGFMGYDFSGGYTSLEGRRAKRDGVFKRWRRSRAETRKRREAESVEALQAEVDRILAKVHEQGIHSLSRTEKRTLESATQSQRERERPRV